MSGLDEYNTPAARFFEAARKDNLPLMQELLAKEPRLIHARSTNKGRTALHLAALCDNPGIVRFLLQQGADPNAEEKLGKHFTPLRLAVDNQRVAAVDMLLHHRDTVIDHTYLQGDINCLHDAAIQKNHALVQRLLDAGANPEIACGIIVKNGIASTSRDIAANRQDEAMLRIFDNHSASALLYPQEGLTGLLPLDAEKVTALLQTRGGWQHLPEIHAHFPLDKDFLLGPGTHPSGTPLAQRAVACYETASLVDFLAGQGQPLTADDVLAVPQEGAASLLDAITGHHALEHLFTQRNWRGQPSDEMKETWRAVPQEEKWQVQGFRQLLVVVESHEPERRTIPGRA